MNFNQIDEIEEGGLDLPKLEWLELQDNRLKVVSDLSNSLRFNNLKHLNVDDNPSEIVDLKTFSKYANLEYLNLKNTSFDLDAFNASTDDIQASQ